MTENELSQKIKNRFDKARIAMDRKNYKYAIELLMPAIKQRPTFADARELLRVAEIKNYEENPPAFLVRLALRISSYALRIAAAMNKAAGNNHAAILIYETILKSDPHNTAVLIKLGSLLNKEGMKKSSAITLECAIKTSKRCVIAYKLLGEVYSELGNYDRAYSCFKKVLELKPNDHDAEKGIKNIAALTTIDKSFDKKDSEDFKIREITE